MPPAEGENCDPSAGISPPPCNSMLDYCDDLTSVCLRKIAVGMPCPNGKGCVDYAYCDPGTLTCVAKGRAGEACDDHDYSGCMGSLICVDTCVLPSIPSVCPLEPPDATLPPAAIAFLKESTRSVFPVLDRA